MKQIRATLLNPAKCTTRSNPCGSFHSDMKNSAQCTSLTVLIQIVWFLWIMGRTWSCLLALKSQFLMCLESVSSTTDASTSGQCICSIGFYWISQGPSLPSPHVGRAFLLNVGRAARDSAVVAGGRILPEWSSWYTSHAWQPSFPPFEGGEFPEACLGMPIHWIVHRLPTATEITSTISHRSWMLGSSQIGFT